MHTKLDIYVFIKKTFKYYKLMNYDKFLIQCNYIAE
jgi:hypothetical protein